MHATRLGDPEAPPPNSLPGGEWAHKKSPAPGGERGADGAGGGSTKRVDCWDVSDPRANAQLLLRQLLLLACFLLPGRMDVPARSRAVGLSCKRTETCHSLTGSLL